MPRKKSEDNSFENAFTKLEGIVERLENESDSIKISELIENYKEGLKLIKVCRTKLQDAELEITKIKNEAL